MNMVDIATVSLLQLRQSTALMLCTNSIKAWKPEIKQNLRNTVSAFITKEKFHTFIVAGR